MVINIADNKNLRIEYSNHEEMYRLNEYFTREKRNARFKKDRNSTVKFFRTNNTIPIQLWEDVKKLCITNGFEYKFEEEKKMFRDYELSFVVDWCKKQIKGTEYSEFDMDDTYLTVYKIIANRYGRLDLSVSYGKSVVLYLASKFLIDHKEESRIMILEPKPQLSSQLLGEFAGLHKHGSLPFSVWKAGTKMKDTPIIITNFQLAVNLPSNLLELMTMTMCDECHFSSAPSYKMIITEKCKNVKSTIGVTGSLLEDDSAEDFAVKCVSGGTLKTVTKREVIDAGRASDGIVSFIHLDYVPVYEKASIVSRRYDERISKLVSVDLECEDILKYDWRIKVLAKFAVRNALTKGNGMVLFRKVRGGYAMKFIEYMKAIDKTLKIFYVDEEISIKTREQYCQYMEENNDCVIVGTYDTIGTGISVHNNHWGLMLEPVKSFNKIEQLIGRFMRMHVNKSKFILYDIVDDLRVHFSENGKNVLKRNYLYDWHLERIKIYQRHGFKMSKQEISLFKQPPPKPSSENNFKSIL